MKEITKKYHKDDLTIVWQPHKCIHSGICFKGLGNVFNPNFRPWIEPENASKQLIIDQINKCPSGALSYSIETKDSSEEIIDKETLIEVSPNGPLLVYGNVTVKKKEGEIEKRTNVTAFCRCGASLNKPFCDGSHKKTTFDQ